MEGIDRRTRQRRRGRAHPAHARRDRLRRIRLCEACGPAHQFILPDGKGKSGAKALEGATVPNDLQIRAPDPTSAEAYPIVTYTWILVRKHYEDKRDADTLKALLLHCLEDGQQSLAQDLGYVTLPSAVVARLRAAIQTITTTPQRMQQP